MAVSIVSPLSSATVARPFLKWAGGKGRLLSQYEPYFPASCATYYEPFVGGGAVFFYLAQRMQRAVLGDINPELVNVYRWVRDAPKALIVKLEYHKRHHSPDHYYHMRQQHQLPHPLDRAARLIYLNKTCYNGLYRENSQGQFNVPVGRYKNPAICDPALIRVASASLQPAQIVEQPFTDLLKYSFTPQDFVYLDPPYHPLSATSQFTQYSRHGFGPTDQARLAQVFRQLADWGVRVMLSNSDCEFIRDLYAGFPMHSIQAARMINAQAGRRGKISELLITSY
ncbi:MAG: methyltransferase [Cyanobacteriota bacterium]